MIKHDHAIHDKIRPYAAVHTFTATAVPPALTQAHSAPPGLQAKLLCSFFGIYLLNHRPQ